MSNQIKVLILVVALVGAGFFFYRSLTASSDSGVDLGEISYWVCANESCGKDFELTLAQLASVGQGGFVACPHCGQRKTARAAKCPACSRHITTVGHGSVPELCPHCGIKLGEATAHGASASKGAKPTNTRRPGG